MTTIRVAKILFLFALLAPSSYGAPGDAGPSAPVSPQCPDQDGTCVSFGYDRMMCVVQEGQYVCAAPEGANLCSDGQVCPVGTVCGKLRQTVQADEQRLFPCFRGGPPVSYDGAVGGPCKSLDGHGVLHLCSTLRCSADSPSLCVAAPPAILPPSPGG